MTTFQYFDSEQTMQGSLFDLPSFHDYNSQHSLPSATLYYGTGSTSCNGTPPHRFGSLSASGEEIITVDGDQGQGLAQIQGAVSSSTAAHSPYLLEYGVVPGGNFEHGVRASESMDAGSTAGQIRTQAAAQIPLQAPYISIPSVPFPFGRTAASAIFQPSTLGISAPQNGQINKFLEHQPIPPESESTYLTLAGNVPVQFLETSQLKGHSESLTSNGTLSFSIRSQPQSQVGPPALYQRQRSPLVSVPLHVHSQAAEGGRTVIPAQLVSDPGWATTGSSFVKRTRMEDQPGPAVTNKAAPPVVKRPKNMKEPRKPSLACLFCRERKIACGRPPEGRENTTCNQCARRKFNCIYVAAKPRVRKSSAKPSTA